MYKENQLSYMIRGAAFIVYNSLGPGLLESVYETALAYELKNQNLEVRSQLGIPMRYKHINFDVGYRLDIIVENKVIVEIKSVDTLLDIHHKPMIEQHDILNKEIDDWMANTFQTDDILLTGIKL